MDGDFTDYNDYSSHHHHDDSFNYHDDLNNHHHDIPPDSHTPHSEQPHSEQPFEHFLFRNPHVDAPHYHTHDDFMEQLRRHGQEDEYLIFLNNHQISSPSPAENYEKAKARPEFKSFEKSYRKTEEKIVKAVEKIEEAAEKATPKNFIDSKTGMLLGVFGIIGAGWAVRALSQKQRQEPQQSQR